MMKALCHYEFPKAEAIVNAFVLSENAGKGVIALDGRIAERLHLAEAECFADTGA